LVIINKLVNFKKLLKKKTVSIIFFVQKMADQIERFTGLSAPLLFAGAAGGFLFYSAQDTIEAKINSWLPASAQFAGPIIGVFVGIGGALVVGKMLKMRV
jgi:TRAP-type C4-dicarboxylate transport system permease small subunit